MKSEHITTQRTGTSISYSSLRWNLPSIVLVLTCFALSPIPKALGTDTGTQNTAAGSGALCTNGTGSRNNAIGFEALESNGTGNDNVTNGYKTLVLNISGGGNTAIGSAALSSNTTGNNNIALGIQAGLQLTTGSNNIDIGNFGVAGESNTIRIGSQGTQTSTFVAGIFGASVAGSTVVVNSNGQLGVFSSSKRFKDDIKPMAKTSETILALKPVTFRYKRAIDPDGTAQFGLVAEEVEKVDPALVVHDANGKPYSVRYEAVNAMLLNEFLKEHQKVEQQQAAIAGFQSKLAQQEKQIEALTSGLQKISAELDLSKPRPRMASNRR
jgi:hypothetical protein